MALCYCYVQTIALQASELNMRHTLTVHSIAEIFLADLPDGRIFDFILLHRDLQFTGFSMYCKIWHARKGGGGCCATM